MAKRKFPDLLHPIGGCGFIQFWKLYFNNWPYTLYSLPSRLLSLMAVTFRVPTVFIEKIKHKNAINLQEIKDGPIFIIGHWRSGRCWIYPNSVIKNKNVCHDYWYGFERWKRAVAQRFGCWSCYQSPQPPLWKHYPWLRSFDILHYLFGFQQKIP